MVYTNISIPNEWKKKENFRTFLYKTVNEDSKFCNYLTYTNTFNGPRSSTSYAQTEPNKKPKLHPIKKHERFKQKAATPAQATHSPQHETLLRKNTTNSTKSNLFTTNSKISKFVTDNVKIGKLNNLERLVMKKIIETKTAGKLLDSPNKKTISSIKFVKEKAVSKTEYGPFLNIVRNIKKVEIKNKEVKDLVEECNNFGPYFSHCPSCNNRNLEFYQNMKSDNALKLLKFIRDYRYKKEIQK